MNRRLDDALVRRAAGSRDDLLRLLFEGLGWPRPAGMELEEVPLLDWSPEELHLDPSAVARLQRIEQLPRLTASQPFGVFLLHFEGGRLPIGAVRRVVNQLVRKQRGRKRRADAQWELEDLVFFCQAGEGVDLVHVVAFRESEGRPVLRVITWSDDATEARVEMVAREKLAALSWPDDEDDVAAWRDQWTSGFTATYRQSVRSAASLAAMMADVAAEVRNEVHALYEVETDAGPLRTLFRELKEGLRGDLDAGTFADMYAQTMVYGLLTARLTHPEDFTPDAIDRALSFENPLLDSMYSSFREQSGAAVDVDEFGLRDLAERLAGLDVSELLVDIGASERRDDPVVYFYEEFLDRYDREQRAELGTYYTPVPLVRAIVRLVDEALRDELQLADGIADGTTWAEYTERTGITLPTGCSPDEPVVTAIDPATGTGTFLLEWLRQALDGLPQDRRARTASDVASRIDALEISMSAYAVAHLKTALQLPEEIRDTTTLNILLTDTLAGERDQQMSMLDDDPVAEEGVRADRVKFEKHHTVVLGNPPYDRVRREDGGGWIVDGGATDGSPLDKLIRRASDNNVIFSAHASLYNLYVYFWRWAMWKAFEHREGPGIVAFVTASSWLDGAAFVGLRELARQFADSIYVLDLGGDGLGARTEENVFPIRTPVAVVLLVRGINPDKDECTARYRRIGGSRKEKLDALDAVHLDRGPWEVLLGEGGDPLLPGIAGTDWEQYPALTDLFPLQQPGAMFNRTWPISPTRELLQERWRQLMHDDDPAWRARAFVTPKTGRNTTTQVADLTPLRELPTDASHRPIVRYAFRSFDRQWTYDDPRVAALERPALWDSLSPRQVFVTSMTTNRLGAGPAATATAYVPDKHHFRGSYGGKDVIPLYRDADGMPNADPALLTLLSERLDRSVDVTDLFAYAYGVLAGTDYTTRFLDELETPGPRVPLTAEAGLFDRMAELGGHLLWLHTYGERFTNSERTAISVPDHIAWEPEPTVPPAKRNDWDFDEESGRLVVGGGSLSGVRPEVWAFEVSGMRIIEKWLNYRTVKPPGRAGSGDKPLDQIRPSEWHPDWSVELRELVHVLDATLDYIEVGTELLTRIMAGPLIPAGDLPQVPDHLREVPDVDRDLSQLTLGQ